MTKLLFTALLLCAPLSASYIAHDFSDQSSLSLPQFDPALGTLSEVSFWLTGQASVQITGTNTGSDGVRTYTDRYGQIRVSSPLPLTHSSFLSFPGLDTYVPAGGTVAGEALAIQIWASMILAEAGGLESYMGVGTWSPSISVSASLPVVAGMICPEQGGGLCSIAGTVYTSMEFIEPAGYSGRLVYTYTPAVTSTPEPGFLWPILLFCLAAFLWRFRAELLERKGRTRG